MRTRLKEVRKSKGLSQKDAAQMFGVSLGTYRNWEQGRVVMNGEQLINAARLFDTDVDFILMTDVDDEKERQFIELEQLYDSLNDDGRETLVLVARAISEKFKE